MHDQLIDENLRYILSQLSKEMRENLESRAVGEVTALKVTFVAKAGK
jgi:hypothetical protein